MSDFPSTIEELHGLVVPSDGRVKFAVKVLHVLQYTKAHPEAICQLGAAWFRDGRHFIVNSTILGYFLTLKSNTINANFHDHGFVIIPRTFEVLRREFLFSDTRHWKNRMNVAFTIDTTVSEAEQIRSGPERVLRNETQDLFLPTALVELIGSDQAQLVALQQLSFSLQQSRDWILQLFTFVTQFWKTEISPISLVASVDDIARALSVPAHLHSNLGYLLDLYNESSLPLEVVNFVGFVQFFIQYGFHLNRGCILGEISDDGSRFKSWFTPSFDTGVASNQVVRGGLHTWKVMPSKNPTQFTLLYQGPDRLIALRIAHDAMAEKVDKQFSVEFEGGIVEYEPTLDRILRETLHLRFPEREVEPIPVNPIFVVAEIIQRAASEAPTGDS